MDVHSISGVLWELLMYCMLYQAVLFVDQCSIAWSFSVTGQLTVLGIG